MNRRKFISTVAGGTAAVSLAGCTEQRDLSEVEMPENYEPVVVGDEDAPVSVYEFFDLGCPACQQFHEQVTPFLETDYISTGDVKLIKYDTPFGAGSSTFPAAHASREMHHNGGVEEYQEFVDLVYQNQNNIDTDMYVSWAEDISGLGEEVRDAIETEKYQDELDESVNYANDLGVDGIPTIMVGWELYEFPSFDQLSSIIEEELQSQE